MADIIFAGEEGIRQFTVREGVLFGPHGADAGDPTDNNVFFAVVGGTGRNSLYITRGKEGQIIRWSLEEPHDLPPIRPKGFSTSALEALDPPVLGDVGADIVLHYNGHLVLANTKEYTRIGTTAADAETRVEYHPYRVRWSAFGDFENFTESTVSTAGYADLIRDANSAPILAILPLRGVLIAYKRNAVYILSTGSELLLEPDRIVPDRGIIAPKAVAPVHDGNIHLMVSDDNIYLFDGQQIIDAKDPVGDRVRAYLFSELDFSRKDSIYVNSIPLRSECWITFPTRDGGRQALCWDWEEDSWTRHEIPARCVKRVLSLADVPIVFAGSDQAEPERQGLIRLFQQPDGSFYTQDNQNRIFRDQGEQLTFPIHGRTNLPMIPLAYRERGEGVRQRSYFIGRLEMEMDVGEPDPERQENREMQLKRVTEEGSLIISQRYTDDLTRAEETSDPMTAVASDDPDDPVLSHTKYTLQATEKDRTRPQKQYIGLTLEFRSESHLEEVGQIVESDIVSEPF